jgi:hypothetical protein
MTSIIIILFNLFFKSKIPDRSMFDLDYKEGVNTALFFIFIDMIIMFMYIYFV